MLRTILVPLDGSSLAESALPFAGRLARRAHAGLRLVRAVPLVDPAHFSDPTAMQLSRAHALADALDAKNTLTAAAGQFRDAGIAAEASVQCGEPAQVILDEAHARDADLIVMSTHGWGGFQRWLYGSVADQVLRRADVPVLLVPGACRSAWPDGCTGPVVVPLDGSSLAEEALKPAGVLARTLGATLLLLQVVEPQPMAPRRATGDAASDAASGLAPARDANETAQTAAVYLEGVADVLRAAGCVVETRVAIGSHPPTVITSAVRDERAALIAMATHGRSGLQRVILGSIAAETLQLAEVPLLLVRPAAMRWRRAVISPETLASGQPMRLALMPDEIRLLRRGLEALLAAGQDTQDALVAAARRLHARLGKASAISA